MEDFIGPLIIFVVCGLGALCMWATNPKHPERLKKLRRWIVGSTDW